MRPVPSSVQAVPCPRCSPTWVARRPSCAVFFTACPASTRSVPRRRAASLATRSIKTSAKLWALEMAVRMVDLTTLEGADTPGQGPQPLREGASSRPRLTPPCRPVAAVCIYSDLVPVAKRALAGSSVAVASVATAFPSGRASLEVKLADVRDAVVAGADEVDMVIDRGAFLSGRYGLVLEEVQAVKQACGQAHLKVILETGELVTYDNVRRASYLAMVGGADFIKTSTGKVSPSATLPVALVMLEAVRDFAELTGTRVGVKVAGGIRNAKDAIRYLVIVNETVGEAWLDPSLFRFGASSLLNDLLMQRSKQLTGAYAGTDDYSLS